MSLVKETLAAAIKNAIDSAYTAAAGESANSEEIRQNYANAIADAFDSYIKSVTITIGPGVIQVAGTAAAQTNPSPIVITNVPPNSIG